MPTPIAGLKVGFSYDYMDGLALPFLPGTNTLSKYNEAFTAYLMFQATEKLKLNARAEYDTASNGVWYTPSATSHNAKLLGLTGTIDYSLWQNVISRVEVRWDHSLSADRPYNVGTDAAPASVEKNAVTVALNVIYNF
jgi:Tfp pilus assembly protein PilZ